MSLLFLAACGRVSSSPPDAAILEPLVDAMPDAAPALMLTLEQAAITAPLSIGVEVDVTVVRSNFDGDVSITLAAPPAGITVPAVLTIPTGQTTGTFRLRIAGDAAAGVAPLVVRAGALADTVTADASLSLTIDANAPGFDTEFAGLHDGVSTQTIWTSANWSSKPAIHVRTRGGHVSPVTARWLGLPPGVTAEQISISAPDFRVPYDMPLVSVSPTEGDTAGTQIIVSDGTMWQALTADVWVSNATLDTTIAAQGRATVAIEEVVAVDADSTGRPIVIGSATGTLQARRFTSTGQLDTTFGTGGIATIPATGWAAVDGAVVGDLVYVLAHPANYVPGTTLAIGRWTAAGAPDLTWGANGLLVLTTGQSENSARRMRIRGNGTIYIAGQFENSAKVLCVTSAGAMCANYDADGDDGVSAGVQGGGAYFRSLRLDSQNRVVAVGRHGDSVLVARFTTDGALDPTFNDGSPFIQTFDRADAWDVETDAMDRIVVVGHRDDVGNSFVARLTATGVLDTTFSNDGVDSITFASEETEKVTARRVRVVANSITVFGSREDVTQVGQRPLLVRYTPDGVRDSMFGRQGGDLVLGGTTARELFIDYRAVMGTYWLLAFGDVGVGVLMKHTGM